MIVKSQTTNPTRRSKVAEFVSGPPRIRSMIRRTVIPAALATRMVTSPMLMTRTSRDRRSMRPGSAMMTDTSNITSIAGKIHDGPQLYRRGSDSVRATATMSVRAIGQRFSPRTSTVVISMHGRGRDANRQC